MIYNCIKSDWTTRSRPEDNTWPIRQCIERQLRGEMYLVAAIKTSDGTVSADPYQQDYVYYRVQNGQW